MTGHPDCLLDGVKSARFRLHGSLGGDALPFGTVAGDTLAHILEASGHIFGNLRRAWSEKYWTLEKLGMRTHGDASTAANTLHAHYVQPTRKNSAGQTTVLVSVSFPVQWAGAHTTGERLPL